MKTQLAPKKTNNFTQALLSLLLWVTIHIIQSTQTNQAWATEPCEALLTTECSIVEPYSLRHQNKKTTLINSFEIGDRVEIQEQRFFSNRIVTAQIQKISFDGILFKEDRGSDFFLAYEKINSIKIIERHLFQKKTQAMQIHDEIKNYLAFLDKNRFDSNTKNKIKKILEEYKALSSTSKKEEYAEVLSHKILQDILKSYDTTEIGFHFNLNGGDATEYIEKGGILISRGDVGIKYHRHTQTKIDLNEKIYFFRSSKISLYRMLSLKNPNLFYSFGENRMGTVLNIFNLHDPYFNKAKKEKGITNENDISFDFDPQWVEKQDFNHGSKKVGIPLKTYLRPPIAIFDGLSNNLFKAVNALSRDEKTIVQMLLIETILLNNK